MKSGMLAGALVMSLLCPAASFAQSRGLNTVAATLSILAGTVHRVPAGGNQLQAATDGMDLSAGDRIVTWPKGSALITFLDGSTVTVQPNSDVAVKKAETAGGKASAISIQINVGTVWARVVRALDPKASFSLESNTATATVHDGLIGGQQNADGSFVCWTRAGTLTVKDPRGQALVTLQPNEKTTVQTGQKPSPQPFSVNHSALKIVASGNVLPLVEMPDKLYVAGFVAPTWEVNQVFGAYTGKAAEGSHVVEVPAGASGPYLLILHGLHEGPFKISIAGTFKGEPVYHQELAGTVKKGERLRTEITQQMEDGAADPKTAKARNGSVVPLSHWFGPLPGTIVLSPAELKGAAGN